METGFLAAVDAAVAQALPSDWPRVPDHRLPAWGGIRARHAFRRRNASGPESYLAIVAVPAVPIASPAGASGAASPAGAAGPADGALAVHAAPAARAADTADIADITECAGACGEAGAELAASALATVGDTAGGHAGRIEGELAGLIELILGRGAAMLLLVEGTGSDVDSILDRFGFPHPRFLALACAPAPAGLDVEPTWCGAEPLWRTIADLWDGCLAYDGPREGQQIVGVEIMTDACRRCGSPLDTVTGIVLPDREVVQWSSPDWSYYQQLAEVAALPDSVIVTLTAAVDGWRAAGESRLTPIRWRYGSTIASSRWAAECPYCSCFRGSVAIQSERFPKLASLASRRTGALSYRPLSVDVPRQLLTDLSWACELTPHARTLGWRRDAPPSLGLDLIAALHANPVSAAWREAVHAPPKAPSTDPAGAPGSAPDAPRFPVAASVSPRARMVDGQRRQHGDGEQRCEPDGAARRERAEPVRAFWQRLAHDIAHWLMPKRFT